MRFLRSAALALGLSLLVAILIGLELYFIKLPSVDILTRLLLIGLLTLNTLALIALVFLVARNLYALYQERHHRVPGYMFRTKLMIIFVVLTFIPSAFLFFAASGLASNYISRIFSQQMKAPFSKSVELARAFYDYERERLLKTAKVAASGKDASAPGVSVRKLSALSASAPDIVKDAFNGREGSEIVSTPEGDLVRAAVPDRLRGVVLAETMLPRSIAEKSEGLKDLHEDYLKLESFKEPLRFNYIMTMGFLTLLMVFVGLWVSLKISGGITVPIKNLALATEQVAGGNLGVQVEVKSKDEVGLLTNSFNQMVRQLGDSKTSLENAYLESDRRRLYLENILENINSGVIFLDPEGRVLTMNRAACSILDVRTEDIIGRHYRELVQGLHSSELEELVRDMEGTRIRRVIREVKVVSAGRPLICRLFVSGLRESTQSHSQGMLVVFNDITDVVKAQKAMAWHEVARRMAHEIKNPLTPIKLSTERLLKKWSQGDEDFGVVLEKSTKTIISEVDSLKRLVDEFARYGRMPELTKRPVNFAEFLDSVVSLYRGFKDVEIELQLQGEIPQVNMDAEQFKRVLINIMDNAINAMNNSGALNIVACADQETLRLDIADTGPGISDNEKEKLFLPYFSRTKGGTGLGLAIASKIIADHGGQITVQDNNPTGSVFRIEIPLI